MMFPGMMNQGMMDPGMMSQGMMGPGMMSQGMMGPGMMGHQAVTEPRNYFEREMGNSYMHEGPSPAFGLNMLGNNGGAFNSGS